MSETRLIDRLIDGAKDTIKALKRIPLIRLTKINFHSAVTNIQGQIAEKRDEVLGIYENVGDIAKGETINNIIKLKGEIRRLEEKEIDIRETYKELFNTDMKETDLGE